MIIVRRMNYPRVQFITRMVLYHLVAFKLHSLMSTWSTTRQHYTQGGIECIDAIKAATVGKTGIEAVCVANVVKYLWRYEEKNGLEDVKKARWYLERLISELENK